MLKKTWEDHFNSWNPSAIESLNSFYMDSIWMIFLNQNY